MHLSGLRFRIVHGRGSYTDHFGSPLSSIRLISALVTKFDSLHWHANFPQNLGNHETRIWEVWTQPTLCIVRRGRQRKHPLVLLFNGAKHSPPSLHPGGPFGLFWPLWIFVWPLHQILKSGDPRLEENRVSQLYMEEEVTLIIFEFHFLESS